MLCLDVNILVYAAREDAAEHSRYRDWLQGAIAGPEAVGISPIVLSGFTRIVTHPRIWTTPSSPQDAGDFCNVVLQGGATQVISHGRRTWDLCQELITSIRARGNDVADAFLAASALEHRAIFVTTDRGFHRFPGLRVRHPLA